MGRLHAIFGRELLCFPIQPHTKEFLLLEVQGLPGMESRAFLWDITRTLELQPGGEGPMCGTPIHQETNRGDYKAVHL